MPELPEVEIVRTNIDRSCSGRAIRSVEIIDDGVLEGCTMEELASFCLGRTIIGARRHGKQMFIELDRGRCVTVHLGMTGDLIFNAERESLNKYDRVLFDFKDGSRIVYRDMRKFGAIGLAASVADFIRMKRLGPDALEVGRHEFIARIGKHDRAIKTVLLDQKVIAGIGNLYADEILFQSRIHPMRSAMGLSAKEAGAIQKNTRKVLLASVRVSSDFDRLPKGFMLPLRELGASCPRGNGRLTSVKVNGRTTFFCPSCQTE